MWCSCGESRHGNSADTSDESQAKEQIRIDSPAAAVAPDKFYGIDSATDTILYERDGKILSSGYVQGTFERIDRGDFMHFVVRDSNGYLHRFFIYLDNQRQMDKYYEGYEPARGHPVSIKWVRGPLRIDDDSAVTTVYQAKEIIE
jgi:hypothetical protein